MAIMKCENEAENIQIDSPDTEDHVANIKEDQHEEEDEEEDEVEFSN